MGYTTLTVKAGEKGEFIRYPDTPGLAVSECAMENESLHVEIEPNGTLTLTEKQSGQIYHRLLTLEDSADIGDGWYHGQAVNDQVFVSTASRAATALVHNGPQMAVFKIRVLFPAPEAFDFTTMHRTEAAKDLVVEHLITLRKDQNFVEVETRVDNTTCDHRMRVLLPSGANTETYLADSAFDVIERPIALRKDNYLYRELEVETKPQQSWTAVFDEERGLAVIADGLLESAVRDLPEHPIALTLFRGTRRTVGTNGEPGGQLQGPLTFKYWIAPISGNPNYRQLCEMGQQVSAGYQIAQLDQADKKIYGQEQILPRSGSFLEVTGEGVISSARMVGKGMEVRMFNPHDTDIPTTLKLAKALQFGQYQIVDLESNPQNTPTAFSEAVDLTLKPKQILTLRFTA
jgi:alpha-mannosidase/mannosylglycerate hydrolase